MFAYLHCLIFL